MYHGGPWAYARRLRQALEVARAAS